MLPRSSEPPLHQYPKQTSKTPSITAKSPSEEADVAQETAIRPAAAVSEKNNSIKTEKEVQDIPHIDTMVLESEDI